MIFSKQRAEDYYMRRRFEYYVLAAPTMSDHEFDLMERYFRELYPDSAILHSIGSSNAQDYPPYVREQRRPFADERRYADA